MITKTEKSKARAKIRSGIPLEEIASEFEIPMAVIEEWQQDLDPDEVQELETNTIALERVTHNITNGELEDFNPDLLQQQLEKSAMDIAKAVPLPLINGDAIHAAALKNCAEAISKLYTTIILKNGMTIRAEGENADQYSDQTLMAFQNALRD